VSCVVFGHMSDASDGLCLEAVLVMNIYPYVTDKPLWLDGHL